MASQTPIAARLSLASPVADGPLTCTFDWRHESDEAWTIDIRTSDGMGLRLSDGGETLTIDGAAAAAEGPGEYPDIYNQFVDLIDTRRSHVDVAPLRLVADAGHVAAASGVAIDLRSAAFEVPEPLHAVAAATGKNIVALKGRKNYFCTASPAFRNPRDDQEKARRAEIATLLHRLGWSLIAACFMVGPSPSRSLLGLPASLAAAEDQR